MFPLKSMPLTCQKNKFTMKITLTLLLLLPLLNAHAQNELSKLFEDSSGSKAHQKVIATFKSDHIVNAQSNETLHQHDLVLNITHRFDDIAGSFGGVKTFFGLDNSTDIRIGLEYGITDRLTVGFARAKGAPATRTDGIFFNSLKQLWEGKIKYRLWQQTEDDHVPFAVTIYANAVVSGQPAFDDPSSDIYFQEFSDRWSFMAQAIIARKFNDNFSLAILPVYIRRNLVAFGDQHDLFALGIGGRLKVTKTMALVIDYFFPFRKEENRTYFKEKGVNFYNPLAIGWEIQTGGHVFHINFTNSTAILGNQFIPYTNRSWTKGEFRWGFNISRTFTLFSGKKQDWKPAK